MLFPVVALILGVFVWGLLVGVFQSLGYYPAIGNFTLTLSHYKSVLLQDGLFQSLLFSFKTSFIASFISVLLGVCTAMLLLKEGNRGRLPKILYKLPIAVPHTVAALIVYTLFSQSGMFSRILHLLGFVESTIDAPLLIFDRGGVGIILAYIWKVVPFSAMVCYSTLQKMDMRLVRVAKNLGAGSFQAFMQILLPQLMPTVISVFIISFAYSFGSFEIPYLLGPSSPQTLPELAYSLYTSVELEDRSKAMAVNVIITAVTLVLVWVYSLALGKRKGGVK